MSPLAGYGRCAMRDRRQEQEVCEDLPLGRACLVP